MHACMRSNECLKIFLSLSHAVIKYKNKKAKKANALIIMLRLLIIFSMSQIPFNSLLRPFDFNLHLLVVRYAVYCTFNYVNCTQHGITDLCLFSFYFNNKEKLNRVLAIATCTTPLSSILTHPSM